MEDPCKFHRCSLLLFSVWKLLYPSIFICELQQSLYTIDKLQTVVLIHEMQVMTVFPELHIVFSLRVQEVDVLGYKLSQNELKLIVCKSTHDQSSLAKETLKSIGQQ
ncbi:hypothetical protein D3C80_1508070 [compost metagenome]